MSKTLLDAGPTEKGWHFYEMLLRCLRLAGAARHGLLKRRRKGPALLRGSLGHVGLAHRYAQRFPAAAGGASPADFYEVEPAVRLLATTAAYTESDERWEGLVPLVLDALGGYEARYGDRDDGWKVLAIERAMTARFERKRAGDTTLAVPYRQRADLVVECPDRKIRIPDHKFVGYIDTEKLQRYAISGQFLGYDAVFGRNVWKDRWGGTILNLIEIGDGRREFRYRRVPCPPAPAAAADLVDAVLDAAEEAERMERQGRPWWRWSPKFNEGICRTYEACPLLQWCRFGVPEDVREKTWRTSFDPDDPTLQA